VTWIAGEGQGQGQVTVGLPRRGGGRSHHQQWAVAEGLALRKVDSMGWCLGMIAARAHGRAAGGREGGVFTMRHVTNGADLQVAEDHRRAGRVRCGAGSRKHMWRGDPKSHLALVSFGLSLFCRNVFAQHRGWGKVMWTVRCFCENGVCENDRKEASW
jgi:hypothetical protein